MTDSKPLPDKVVERAFDFANSHMTMGDRHPRRESKFYRSKDAYLTAARAEALPLVNIIKRLISKDHSFEVSRERAREALEKGGWDETS